MSQSAVSQPLPGDDPPRKIADLIVGPWAGAGEPATVAEPHTDHRGREVLTVVVVDYAGNPPDVAAADVWRDWQSRHPDALIQVVHAADGWEPIR